MIEIYVGGDPGKVEKFDPIINFNDAVKWLKEKYDGSGLAVTIRHGLKEYEFFAPLEEWFVFEFNFIHAIKQATGLGVGEYKIKFENFGDDDYDGGFLEYSKDGSEVKFTCESPYIRVFKPGEKDPTGILIDGYVTQEQLVILHLIYEWIATEREPFKL